MNITIIGAGNVGRTLGSRFLEAGHSVTFGLLDPGAERAESSGTPAGSRVLDIHSAAMSAGIVLLTVPAMALEDAILAAGDLTGKIVVDCTNAVGSTFRPTTESGTTIAETVAALLPGAYLVKAFNSVGWQVMENPAFGDRRAVLPICGDDAGAKATVRELAASIGFDPIDVGPLEAAPLVEAFAAMWIGLAHRLGKGSRFAFGLLERSS